MEYTYEALAQRIHRGLIVSCHLDETEPYHTMDYLQALAMAAQLGGACAIRVQGIKAVEVLSKTTSLPVIGFTMGSYSDKADLITPDFDDIERLFAAGAHVVAIDSTKRKRPNDHDGFVFFELVRKRFSGLLWADVSTFREGIRAAESGADFVATTLAGYTPGTEAMDYRTPDYPLIQELSGSLTIPVIAEGRIWTPESARKALNLGAHAVVVGSAITRPRIITRMFVEALK